MSLVQCGSIRSHVQYGFSLAIVLTAILANKSIAQSTITWNDTSSNWISSTSWTPAGPTNWVDPQRLADTKVSFASQATITHQPSIGGNDVFVNGVSIDSSQATWSISGTGVLNISSGGMSVTGTNFNTATISTPVQITTNETWSVGLNARLQLTNTFSGSGSLTKAGDGTLILSGSSTNTGDISVAAGILIVAGDRSAATGSLTAAGGFIQLTDGTRLGGDVAFQGSQGGTSAAETNSPAIFGDSPEEVDVMGSMTVDDESTIGFKIYGSLPDLGYDRINIGHDVHLIDGKLEIDAANFVAHVGDLYFIINNEGSNPIDGSFTNAAEGSTLFSNGYKFRITYFADTDTNSASGGNDIALISVPEVPATVLLFAVAVPLCLMARNKPRAVGV